VNARRLLPWALLGVVVIGTIAFAASGGDDDPSARRRARDLASELRCPDCEGQSVADSQTPTARAIRADISMRIRSGESDETIRQAYIDRYGSSILLKPEGSGIGLLVWGLPAAALIAGAGGLVLALRRWRGEPRLHATDADEALVEKTRSSS
jgi:cytochrome c-type biogenesis protein CcmH